VPFVGFNDHVGYSPFDTSLPLEEALAAVDSADLPGEYYGVAGRFISHIDTTYGRRAVLELEFEALEACPQTTFRDASAACLAADQIEWCDGSNAFAHKIELACDSPNTIGVRDDELWTYRVVTVPAPGRYGIYISYFEEPIEGYAELGQCDGGCQSFRERVMFPLGGRLRGKG
jgi:hypothetical protein